jgi:hypothetical protein
MLQSSNGSQRFMTFERSVRSNERAHESIHAEVLSIAVAHLLRAKLELDVLEMDTTSWAAALITCMPNLK